MILKRQEKNGKIKAMYSSATICASIFDTTTNDLIVIFNNGGQYKYPSVDLTDYTRFEIAESNGAIFNTYIKKKYTNFEKMDKLSESTIKEILKEIDELKKVEEILSIEDVAKVMMETIALALASYVSTGNVENDIFKKLQKNINEYDKVINYKPESNEQA